MDNKYGFWAGFSSDSTVRELPIEFVGVGEVRGFEFTQLENNGVAYVYEVKCSDDSSPHYEVFKRVVNDRFGVVSYPKSKAFGIWAYCCTSLDAAYDKYYKLSNE